MAMQNTAQDLRKALTSARNTMTMSSRDWSTARDFAWLYGLLVGWDDDPDEVASGDTAEGDALGRMAERFGWTDEAVARLTRMRASIEAVTR